MAAKINFSLSNLDDVYGINQSRSDRYIPSRSEIEDMFNDFSMSKRQSLKIKIEETEPNENKMYSKMIKENFVKK